MGMCCWMAFHFHDRIDCNGVAFCIFNRVPDGVTRIGLQIFGVLGAKKILASGI